MRSPMRRIAADSPRAAARTGFTLIEMLVATTLVVLMMLMFAEIYTAAIRSINDQQSNARGDQRARSIDQVLRADLMRASYREIHGARGIVPLVEGDTVNPRQKGYFYISENDPNNRLDDVLQFTMFITPGGRSKDQTPFYGRCIGGAEVPNTLRNHPDDDDGIQGNDIGFSRAAEVVYFVRNGNLYRRQILLRDPTFDNAQFGAQPIVNSGGSSGTMFAGNVVAMYHTGLGQDVRGSFLQRFDYSAYWDGTSVRFMGVEALDNYGGAGAAGAVRPSLGRSAFRYGFNHITGMPVEYAQRTIPNAAPFDYEFFGRLTHAETNSRYQIWPGGLNVVDQSDNPIVDIATQNPIAGPLRYDVTTERLGVEEPTRYDELFNEIRANEDLLLTNVESFDVRVWDPGLNEDLNLNGILDAGENTNGGVTLDTPGNNPDFAPGFYNIGQGPRFGFNSRGVLQNSPNPVPALNWIFDTGHPSQWNSNPQIDNHFGAGDPWNWSWDRVPMRPLVRRLTEDRDGDGNLDLASEDIDQDRVLNEDKNGNSVLDPGEDSNGNMMLDNNDTNGNGYLEPSEDFNNNGLLDVSHSAFYRLSGTVYPTGSIVFRPGDISQSIAYRAVQSGEDRNGNNHPSHNMAPDASEDADGDGVLDAGEDLNNNSQLDYAEDLDGDMILDWGTTAADGGTIYNSTINWPVTPGQRVVDGTVTWEAFDNRIGLEAIRIIVRTRDSATGNPRQITIDHSFIEPPLEEE